MKLNFKPTRWNFGKYQVNGCGNGFYCVLIFGEYEHSISLSATAEEAMGKAQIFEDAETTEVNALESL